MIIIFFNYCISKESILAQNKYMKHRQIIYDPIIESVPGDNKVKLGTCHKNIYSAINKKSAFP